MFWRLGAGFSQPSPIDQILDKDEFTLEQLLDEDDIIQECKSLNGRLVAFLRERSTVEQLVRYIVEPPLDSDDIKRSLKYPFTACEVFCCEVQQVFNTLVDDMELMQLLFSLLEGAAPLNSKAAGYFGRVVSILLVRKTAEMMQYLQDSPGILARLVDHVDTTSIADIIKRLVGGEDQSSMLFIAQYSAWLAETPLVDLLLARLSQGSTPDAQSNAADILSAIAHTQPSPLAAKLTKEECIDTLFKHAMAPGKQVLVPALDVCVALVEPRRGGQMLMEDTMLQEAADKAKADAVQSMVQHLPQLAELLQNTSSSTAPPETPHGLLNPPLGRARLKVAELFTVLLRSGSEAVEGSVMSLGTVQLCMQLFRQYPFNNLLHHYVAAMLIAVLTKASDSMLEYAFEQCKLIDWLLDLPVDVRPQPLRGQEEIASAKAPLRAGYMGHVTQIASTLESFSVHPRSSTSSGSSGLPAGAPNNAVAGYLEAHPGWHKYLEEVLHPRQELENTGRWACGRPAVQELIGLNSDADDYQHEMGLDSMQPALYHRYNVDEGDEEEDDQDDFKASAFSTQMITHALHGMDLSDGAQFDEHIGEEDASMQHHDDPEDYEDAGPVSRGSDASARQGMEDDDVLLATSDEDDLEDDADAAATSGDAASALNGGLDDQQPSAAAVGPADTGIVEEESAQESSSTSQRQPQQQHTSSSPGRQQASQGQESAAGAAASKDGSEAWNSISTAPVAASHGAS